MRPLVTSVQNDLITWAHRRPFSFFSTMKAVFFQVKIIDITDPFAIHIIFHNLPSFWLLRSSKQIHDLSQWYSTIATLPYSFNCSVFSRPPFHFSHVYFLMYFYMCITGSCLNPLLEWFILTIINKCININYT